MLPSVPAPRRVHLVGIGGTGMGSLAGLYAGTGWEVRGSDTGVHPPMSEILAALGIEVYQGYAPRHLDWGPDLVVIGNIARLDNLEAVEARRRGLPCTSMAAAVSDTFLAGRHPIVVTGTHGKTTTSALIAWGLAAAGRDPGFLVGGVLRNFSATAAPGRGDPFVIEGDEYGTASFDPRPKFLHYRPRTAVLTSIELDHVEVFADLAAVISAFRSFVDLIPKEGRLVACGEDPRVVEVAGRAACPVTFYGFEESAGIRPRLLGDDGRGMEFEIVRGGKVWGRFRSPLSGRHNLLNLTAAAEVLAGFGLGAQEVADGIARFAGVKRRQEIRGKAAGVTVIDDFAHHPTAVRETLLALRQRHPGRRLVAVFEPRTNSSRRAIFQGAYTEALAEADEVLIGPVYEAERAPAGDRFDPEAVCAALLHRGKAARAFTAIPAIADHVASTAREGDIVAVMSNGAFGGLHDLLLARLAARVVRGSPEDAERPGLPGR